MNNVIDEVVITSFGNVLQVENGYAIDDNKDASQRVHVHACPTIVTQLPTFIDVITKKNVNCMSCLPMFHMHELMRHEYLPQFALLNSCFQM